MQIFAKCVELYYMLCQVCCCIIQIVENVFAFISLLFGTDLTFIYLDIDEMFNNYVLNCACWLGFNFGLDGSKIQAIAV